MTCTNPVRDIFPDAELLHFKGFKFARPAQQAPVVFGAKREISRTREREREKGGKQIKESCLLSPLRVPLAWSKPAPATQAKDLQVFTQQLIREHSFGYKVFILDSGFKISGGGRDQTGTFLFPIHTSSGNAGKPIPEYQNDESRKISSSFYKLYVQNSFFYIRSPEFGFTRTLSHKV